MDGMGWGALPGFRTLAAAAALAVAALGAAEAGAADPANIGCPAEALSDADRAALTRGLLADEPSTEGDREVLFAAVDRCGEQHGWSLMARATAVVHNLSLISLAELRRRLAAAGVDVPGLERRVLADRRLIRASRSDRFPDAALTRFLNRLDPALRARVQAPGATDLQRDVGSFVILRAMLEASRLNFAEQ